MRLTPQGVLQVGQQMALLVFYLSQAFLVVTHLMARIMLPILSSGTTLVLRRLLEALCYRTRQPLLPLKHKNQEIQWNLQSVMSNSQQ